MWLKLASSLTGFGAIACACTPLALAQQITGDTRLPLGQRTQVINNNPNFQIDGGATQGTNLFHSFNEFSVPTGGEAFFNNATTVQNIISRVTGSIPSDIQGTIRANGTANLFLINPQGIVFGPNARLSIGGSFIASTANSVIFQDGVQFSATNPDAAPLLTVSVPIGLQLNPNSGSIENQSRTSNSLGQLIGLQVQPEKTLALVGGDVTLAGGILSAPNGRIELGSVAGNSMVRLTSIPTGYALGYNSVESFQDINLEQQATVTTIGNLSGSIQVQGANLTLLDNSLIQVGIFGNGSGEGLTVNASESVQLIGAGNRLFTLNEGTATSGNLTITTPRLLIQDGSEVVSSTTGFRKGGDLNINTSQLLQVTGSGSRLFTQTESREVGASNGGNLTINTGELLIQNRGQISVGTLGFGDGGDLNVIASQSVELVGRDSRLLAQTESQATGDAGNLTITTPVLRVLDGAQVIVSTLGAGNAGNLTVNATESTQLISRSQDGVVASGLFAQTQGSGDGGDLTITTSVLRVLDGAQVSAGTLGAGNAGNLTVNAAESTQLIGRSQNGRFASGLFAQAESQATGNAGNLTITTPILQIFDGAQVSVGTLGAGNGGNLTVDATTSVTLIGRSVNGEFASGLFNQAESQATGNAGDLTITTATFQVFDGAQVSAGTLGSGNGGSLTVNATKLVELIGRSSDNRFPSGFFTQTQSTGDAGEVRVTTPILRVLDGAEVSAATLGTGEGGNVIIKAADLLRVQNGSQISVSSVGATAPAGNLDITSGLVQLDGGRLVAQTLSGNGGNITLNIADLLLLRRGSTISTTAGTNASGGDGGNISIKIPNGFIVAIPSENSDITANAFTGSGGRIDITAQNLFGLQSRPFDTPESDITASSEFGINGVVNINTPDVDPSRGVIALSTNVIDPSQIVDQGCTAFDSSQGSQFTVTGRGGLPASPNEPFSGEVVWSDTRILNTTAQRHQSRTFTAKLPKAVDVPSKIPATGWIFNKGEVTLIAHAPTTNNTSWFTSTCHAR
ncbi:S-layer family protein [Fortiea sp. LEGE XX443]|uniref:two-partner secretion domain-containing protein n=1 Tax=Fortiea sp. LEGE XX443 TaxID=1828611 RepID=UPI00187FFF31|nr:S-layer family protein [Fortiea sp. LEGE XX443]MBE9004203.1 S-layer family protein [Fortiea sp. LEGE XX443]